jgi:hypothetical protein
MYIVTYIIFTVNFLFSESQVKNNSNNYHTEREYVPESHPSSEYITNLNIWRTEKFCKKSHNTVSSEKPDSELSRIFYFFSFPQEDSEKKYSFQESFKEWSWEIARTIDVPSKKSIIPRQTHKFTIDIVPYSSEKETNRNYPDELIRNSEK